MKCHLFSHIGVFVVSMALLYIHTFEKADNQVFLLSMVLEISLSFKRFSFDIETPWQLSDLMRFDICESE